LTCRTSVTTKLGRIDFFAQFYCLINNSISGSKKWAAGIKEIFE